MKVLSLFDGMACGMLAMQSAGVSVDRYVAFEIDKYAVQTSSHNFPMIEHRGDVFKADFTEFRGFDFLVDGYYIIRKLTVSECKRLQTVPEQYEFPVSDSQAYKMLGNGWTVEVIAHLIRATQANELEDEQLDLFKVEAM